MKNFETDKLLAEYLELWAPGIGYIEEGVWQPNKDWNQLMKVVEKIEKCEAVTVEISECWCDIIGDPDEGIIVDIGSDTKIEAAYNACVEYIKIKAE